MQSGLLPVKQSLLFLQLELQGMLEQHCLHCLQYRLPLSQQRLCQYLRRILRLVCNQDDLLKVQERFSQDDQEYSRFLLDSLHRQVRRLQGR